MAAPMKTPFHKFFYRRAAGTNIEVKAAPDSGQRLALVSVLIMNQAGAANDIQITFGNAAGADYAFVAELAAIGSAGSSVAFTFPDTLVKEGPDATELKITAGQTFSAVIVGYVEKYGN